MAMSYGATTTEGGPFAVIPSKKKWRILVGLERTDDDTPIISFTDGYPQGEKVTHYVAKSREELLSKNIPPKIVTDDGLLIYAKPYIVGKVLLYANNDTVAIAHTQDKDGKDIWIATDVAVLKKTSDEYHIYWYRYDPA